MSAICVANEGFHQGLLVIKLGAIAVAPKHLFLSAASPRISRDTFKQNKSTGLPGRTWEKHEGAA